MLDLSVFQEKYFELKMFDGEVLKLKKPSQELVIRLMSYEQQMKNDNPAEIVGALVGLLTDILNNNANGKAYSQEFVKSSFDLEVSMVLLKAYMDFVQEVNSNPNS